jgi:uncharacterized spore protein YtfJ
MEDSHTETLSQYSIGGVTVILIFFQLVGVFDKTDCFFKLRSRPSELSAAVAAEGVKVEVISVAIINALYFRMLRMVSLLSSVFDLISQVISIAQVAKPKIAWTNTICPVHGRIASPTS